MTTLTVFVLCHNRPDDARLAIASVLAQTDQACHLIISDNSSTDAVEHMVEASYPQTDYRRRVPMLPPLDHFNRCIEEARESEYFCLFHDDDIMGSEFVMCMKKAATAYPQAIAIGCNAWTEVKGTLQARPSFQSIGDYETIASARDLAYRYFARGQSGIAPFPSYIYKRELVGDARIVPDGGKYSDTTWLLRLAEKGPVVWIREPLMTYRLHGGNDGMTESRRDRLGVLAFLKRKRPRWGKGLLEDYRCSFIYKTLLRDEDRPTPDRLQLARAFLDRYRYTRYLRLDTYQSLLRRAIVKWLPKQ